MVADSFKFRSSSRSRIQSSESDRLPHLSSLLDHNTSHHTHPLNMTTCTRMGCGQPFTDSPDAVCTFHPGAPGQFNHHSSPSHPLTLPTSAEMTDPLSCPNAVFHEGRQSWSCCNKKAYSFDEFLAIPGQSPWPVSATDGTLAELPTGPSPQLLTIPSPSHSPSLCQAAPPVPTRSKSPPSPPPNPPPPLWPPPHPPRPAPPSRTARSPSPPRPPPSPPRPRPSRPTCPSPNRPPTSRRRTT